VLCFPEGTKEIGAGVSDAVFEYAREGGSVSSKDWRVCRFEILLSVLELVDVRAVELAMFCCRSEVLA
jgi:hypothetical protein